MNMTMKRFILLTGTVLLSGTMLFSSQAADAGKSKNYTERAIKGCYVNSLLGSIVPNPIDPGYQIPLSTLVRFCADGKGNAEVLATQDMAGSCILEQTGTATYSVEQTGLGSVTATLENQTASQGCSFLDPPPNVGDKATFVLKFAIQRDNCLQVIGTGLVPEQGSPVSIVLQGEACPQ
jgi:hypothetical protein